MGIQSSKVANEIAVNVLAPENSPGLFAKDGKNTPYDRLLSVKSEKLDTEVLAQYVDVLLRVFENFKTNAPTSADDQRLLYKTERALLHTAKNPEQADLNTLVKLAKVIARLTVKPEDHTRAIVRVAVGARDSARDLQPGSLDNQTSRKLHQEFLELIEQQKKVKGDSSYVIFDQAAHYISGHVKALPLDEYTIPVNGIPIHPNAAKDSLRPGQHVDDDVMLVHLRRLEHEYNERNSSNSNAKKVIFISPASVNQMSQQTALADTAGAEIARLRDAIKDADLVVLPLNDRSHKKVYDGTHWMGAIYEPATKTVHVYNSSDIPAYRNVAQEYADNIYSLLVPDAEPPQPNTPLHTAVQQSDAPDCALFALGYLEAVLQHCNNPGFDWTITPAVLDQCKPTREGLTDYIETEVAKYVMEPWHHPIIRPELKGMLASKMGGNLNAEELDVKTPAKPFDGTVMATQGGFLYIAPQYTKVPMNGGDPVFSVTDKDGEEEIKSQLPVYYVPIKDPNRGDLSDIAVGAKVSVTPINTDGQPGPVNLVVLSQTLEQEGGKPGQSSEQEQQQQDSDRGSKYLRQALPGEKLLVPIGVGTDVDGEYIIYSPDPKGRVVPGAKAGDNRIAVYEKHLAGLSRDFKKLKAIAQKPPGERRDDENTYANITIKTQQELESQRKPSSESLKSGQGVK